MGSGHGHRHSSSDAPEPAFSASRRTAGILLAVLLPILAAAGVAVVVLWPTGTPKTADASIAGSSGGLAPAVVESASSARCPGTSEDRLPDGSIPSTVMCASARIRISAGSDQGKLVTIAVPSDVYRNGISAGDRINVTKFTAPPGESGGGAIYAWADFARAIPLGLLAAAFCLLVVGVARLRGLAAIAGLGVAYLAIITFMLPALRLGENPIAVALAGSILVMTVILYLAHGVSAKTTTALLGTFFGLALSAGLAGWATSAVHLNGLDSEQNHVIAQLTGNADLSGIILCGIIVAGLGVLNDVTITQASAVWEVHVHAPHLGVRALFGSGMRVGRDHLASTVYTIAFAYAGAALPTLILIDLYQQPLGQVITSGQIAEEIVRTLVGSIGLILAIPVTTIVAALVVVAGNQALPTGAGESDRLTPPAQRRSELRSGRRAR